MNREERQGEGKRRGMICCSCQVWNWEWRSEFFKLLWSSDPNTPSHCKHEAFWWNEVCSRKNNTLWHPSPSCWVWMGPRKRNVYSKQTEMDVKSHICYFKWLQTTVSRRTNGFLTTQLLIRRNFPCICRLSAVCPSWLKFEYGAKTGLFWSKSLHRVFPAKMKCGFRRPRGPTSVLFFSLQRRTKTPINCSISVLCSLVVHKNCKSDCDPVLDRFAQTAKRLSKRHFFTKKLSLSMEARQPSQNWSPLVVGFSTHHQKQINKQTKKKNSVCGRGFEVGQTKTSKIYRKYCPHSPFPVPPPGNFPSHLGKFVWLQCFDLSLVPISLYCVYNWVG